jgi:ribonuclease BN (tRNA processing enzyme)|tara:strand:+ start:403 stop:1269 length:867 start_codon:yes stop_codon:yes gene_type:complete
MKNILFLVALIVSPAFAQEEAINNCGENDFALQILGSGGPFGKGRASAGYLLWIDGQSRIMIDAGGGTFAHFHEVGANVTDLQLLAISHFHPDHSAELPALLWPQNGSLTLVGPSGDRAFPSVAEFLDGLFGIDGVFRVLNERFQFRTIEVDINSEASEILNERSVVVKSLGVPHGDVPALGFRVEVGGRSIAFSSDQNGTDPRFVEFVEGVDLLVVHFAGNEDGSGRADLHAKPSVWGEIANEAKVGRLILSHLSINQNFESNLDALKAVYSGPLTVAEDLMCMSVE